MRANPLRDWYQDFQLEDFFDLMDPSDYCVMRCTNCGEITLWKDEKLVYPSGNKMSPEACMPDAAKEVFNEAQNIFSASPRAACAMLRMCVERMVDEKGIKGENLEIRINKLGLPNNLLPLATACRLVGNKAIHTNLIDFSVSNEESFARAHALSKFANRLADELFGITAEAERLIAEIEAAKAKKK